MNQRIGVVMLAFASGVCDWTKQGVNQQPANSPLTFEAGPGGKPLGSAPTSHSL